MNLTAAFQLIPARIRNAIYIAYALLATATGAATAWFLATGGAPTWFGGATAAVGFLGGAIGWQAKANNDTKPKPDLPDVDVTNPDTGETATVIGILGQ